MDKQNINEELEKFKLLSSYSTKKTLSENIEQIKEQYNSPEEEIYYTLVRATSGPGTNEKLLQQAFEKFQNYGQFYKVSRMLKDKPIGGHTDIIPLLRSELGTGDGETIKKIADAVRPKGISINYTMGGTNKNQLDYSKITVSQVQKTPSGYDLSQTKPISDKVITASGDKRVPDTNKKTVNFSSNEKFPLKFMDRGERVKQLQTALGVKNKAGQPSITGNFYTSTEALLKPKATELGVTYTRESGVSEDLFNKIVGSNPNPTNRPLEKPITIDRKRPDLSTGISKNLPTQAPTIQTPTTELGLEQQFQMAKINLDKAKAELDAAQATNDRAKIGAARGKQQAARKEVQRLRNELYPQQQ